MAAVAVLVSCSGTRGGPIAYNPPNFTAPDAVQTPKLEDEYKIAPLDTLHVNVFQVGDLTGDYDVDLTGTISMPLVGTVKVVDLTTRQVDDKLKQLLAEKYLQHPDVSVAVKASSTRVVTVTGAVSQAGIFPVTGSLTLEQAVALAHGTSQDANPHRVAIFRTIRGQRMAAAFDLQSIGRGQMQDPRVYAGDIIVVDGSSVKSTWSNIIQSVPLLAFLRVGI